MGSSGRRRWCTVIVLVAVCALTVSVATRYTSAGPCGKTVTVEKSQSWSPGLQRLLNDAAAWIPPFVDTAIFHDPSCYPHVVESGPTLVTVLLEKNLYNRPPPAVLSFS
jgi:hypothetical protein